MKLIKQSGCFFMALLGITMGIILTVERDLMAIPDLFFGAMFFVMFLRSALDRHADE